MSIVPYRLFLSYSHDDQEYRKRFETHLNLPVRQKRLAIWCDRMIPPGGEWDGSIKDEIRTCDAVIFLVSADLLASDYINDVEMKIARERLARGEIDVLAVPIFHSQIDQTWLAARQALWNPEMPIGALETRAKQEQAWDMVVRKLLEVADISAKSRQPAHLVGTSVQTIEPAPQRLPKFRRSEHAPLLARGGFFGREQELSHLDAWLTAQPPHGDARIIVLRALGGMGKSAIAWCWSQIHAPKIAPDVGFEGVFWWSFYAPGYHIRAFAEAALTFMGVMSDDMPKGLGPRLERLAELTRDRAALFVLDGFERELRRYARNDAPDDAEAAANLAGATRPDACVDQETEAFLSRIAATPGASRWLMTTRVTPEAIADLHGVKEVVLGGLSRDATRALFAEQGITASDAALAEVEARFGGHGLTLSVYARSLKRQNIVDLTPAAARAGGPGILSDDADSAADRRLRVLMESIQALSESSRDVLVSFTFSEKPPSVATLQLLNSHLSPNVIQQALEELRAHGLLAPSDDAFVYEIHPVVREAADRSATGAGIERAIDAFEKLAADRAYETLEEAQPSIDQFLLLAKAKRFEAAFKVYEIRLESLFQAEGATGRSIDLISRLVDPEFQPQVIGSLSQISVLHDLGSSLSRAGRFGDALCVSEQLLPLISSALPIDSELKMRSRLISDMLATGSISLAASTVITSRPTSPSSKWTLQFEIIKARLELIRGNVSASMDICESNLDKCHTVHGIHDRFNLINQAFNLAKMIDDREFHAKIMNFFDNDFDNMNRKLYIAVGEIHKLRHRILRNKAFNNKEARRIAAAARELQARLAAMEVFGWMSEVAVLAAMAEARADSKSVRDAAEEIREIAARYEHNGGVLFAADTRLRAAETWILAGDFEAARADALRARKLAYCDGPPFTAKFFEDRADAILARLASRQRRG
ncbi:toll/interleukin-1 receptor domain-containing protein [Sphingomonas sp. AOB5]|uniref:toll/interleukin-1 receptor domain-containing protein n=1 Tax=Sphingomonas sp. AOB5 TaxID=3034017 RepID=UPI0023F7845D|nr:toll/interleukin-1 receptor domain-containing protein [Sphingomonas sp. AOB5]MDF7777329.1 toll/interleukin-1 receptor domain-containing protein [Sphingomonas sp. AOB5]